MSGVQIYRTRRDGSGRMAADQLGELVEAVIPAGAKGMPFWAAGMTVRQFSGSGVNVLSGDLPMPVAVLKRDRLMSNIAAMQRFCDEHGVSLCPHGKTTMSPQLFSLQLDAGAWGITAATPAHLRMYRHYGVNRIFYANELVEPGPIQWLASELTDHPDFDFYCLADSVAAVERLDRMLATAGLDRPISVLVEVGHAGGRCGVRDRDTAIDVAAAIDAAPRLRLAGVECFEGLQPVVDGDLAAIDGFLEVVADVAADLAAHSSLAGAGTMLVSAGGSAWFDRVIETFSGRTFSGVQPHIVLRSGCYITQDGGTYAQQSPLQGRCAGTATLGNAIEVWSTVLSRPEPGFMVTSLGRRDCSYDMGLPTPIQIVRAGAAPVALPGASVTALSDQHAHVRIPESVGADIGDLVGFAISHPCATFDKWKILPVVDDDYRVVDAVVTLF